jgi:hypothetical protein
MPCYSVVSSAERVDSAFMFSYPIKWISWPRPCELTEYESAIDSMISILKKIPGVLSIYQVGQISEPGISDIDLLVIFEEGAHTPVNPVRDNKKVNRYLFCHRLFGTTSDRIPLLKGFSGFVGHRHLHGTVFHCNNHLTATEYNLIKKQIALEYLLKAFISLQISLTYGTLQVRNFLLHAKALRLDLELLEISDGIFFERVYEIIEMRKKWFESPPGENVLSKIILDFYTAFKEQLSGLFQLHRFYLPDSEKIRVAKNISLVNGMHFQPSPIRLPWYWQYMTRLPISFRLFNRLMSFYFALPFTSSQIPAVIAERHEYLSRGIQYNEKHLPGFLCPVYALNIFTSSTYQKWASEI